MITLEFEKGYIDLDKIYDSGQVFRWKKIDDKEYMFPFGNKERRIKQVGNSIKCENTDSILIEVRLKAYFDIDTDYSKFRNLLFERKRKALDYLLEAERAAKGIRILQQPLWETIVSFIISQNNNIPKIKKSIQALCDKYGHFPTAKEIVDREYNTQDSVKGCGIGYREDYIIAAAKDYIWNNGYTFQRERYLYSAMVEYLQCTKGIGPKVANCICLYGLHYLEAFPRDTWIKRIEQEHFNGHFPNERYPECAGVLQQYMFYHERMKSK